MLRVRDIMSTELVTVSPELSLRDLIELLAKERITGVPVLEGGRTVGVVTLGDVVAFLAMRPGVPTERGEAAAPDEGEAETEMAADEVEVPGEDVPSASYFTDAWSDAGAAVVERFAAPGTPEWDQLEEHTVAEAMTRQLLSVRSSMGIVEAARRMREARVHRLLVMEGNTLVGIITNTDFADAVADRVVSVGAPRKR